MSTLITKPRLSLIALATATMMAMAGCGPAVPNSDGRSVGSDEVNGAPSATAEQSPEEANQPTTKVRFTMSWTANNNQTGVFVAQQKGWFKEAGIDLEVLPYSGQRPTEVISAGAADSGDTNAEAVLNAYINKMPVTMVHNTQQKPSYGILYLTDNQSIKSAKDLDGKKYADWGSGTIRQMVIDAVKNDGGKGQIETVNLAGPDAYTALNEGRVDFTTGFFTVEGLRAKAEGKPYTYLPFGQFQVPANPADIGIVLSNDFISKHPQAAEAFTKTVQKGYDYALEHPEESAELLVKANPDAKLDPELTKKIQEDLSRDYWRDAEGVTGHANLKTWQEYTDYMVKKGLLKDATGKVWDQPIDAGQLVSNEYLTK
ncbi:hypothetical protein BK816_02555 [Boudabousia tangfeifanii]|uniref:Thiamine pyrimidine synthase n=1 Tax=Boudabousia tangfeifanii TaxID=1912795 RepID=A0A1D9MJF8_9ACTO|nr:ABC transporter substrate-binding protein [Boudabousia tangfeifanii]AOZ72319.1 hypothetical protein BK816_02555 [Boudabousia tangfeifanii]